LPNALEVRIDPEFATAANPQGPAIDRTEHSPAELFAEYCSFVGVADDRVRSLFDELHDQLTSTAVHG